MKSVNKLTTFLLACLLAASLAACSQIENGNTTSEGTSSSQPESSISQTSEESSSVPEVSQPESSSEETSSPSSEELDAQYAEWWNDEYGREQLIAAYGKIRLMFQQYVGEDNYAAWTEQAEAEGSLVNIRTFTEHFQMDEQTFLNIIYDVYETDEESNWKELYPTKEDFLHSMYSDEQVEAIFHGDDDAIRKAFHFPADYPVR